MEKVIKTVFLNGQDRAITAQDLAHLACSPSLPYKEGGKKCRVIAYKNDSPFSPQ